MNEGMAPLKYERFNLINPEWPALIKLVHHENNVTNVSGLRIETTSIKLAYDFAILTGLAWSFRIK